MHWKKLHTITFNRQNAYHGGIDGKFFKWVNKQQFITNVGLKKKQNNKGTETYHIIALLRNKLIPKESNVFLPGKTFHKAS